MADQEDEDLRMALRMSMQQPSLPEPKRSKPWENTGSPTGSSEESPENKTRKSQRELMADAAEKRLMMAKHTKSPASASVRARESVSVAKEKEEDAKNSGIGKGVGDVSIKEDVNLGMELSTNEANKLFSMVFGASVSRDILAQWSNQGIRFSPDPETSMGLVQHEGGPCGVLAAIQAFVLKYLIFFPDELGKVAPNMPQHVGSRTSKSECVTSNDLVSLAEDGKTRALVRSMGEILFSCGSNKRAVIATLSVVGHSTMESEDCSTDEIIAKALEGLSIESASDLQKFLRVNTYTSQDSAFRSLEAMIPVFQSRMGALLFLISALLSRGLDSVQADRDDPSLPLVTAPFGHASQEIVNLLLCGQAVPNVFDGNMDLDNGMFVLKGISTRVEVGFLTLLESLNFCKVGQNLKCPRWPIWVVGSESHYTVLFAINTNVQDENELEKRELEIRKSFDAQDQSGGGGFISVEGFHQVLRETRINLPTEKLDQLCGAGFIVWSEFWTVLLDLDKSLGGLKDSTGLLGKKVFDLYHFNGIAKSVLNGSVGGGGEAPVVQRPRLTKLRVSVPPKWTPEEFMVGPANLPKTGGSSEKDVIEVDKPEPPSQQAQLVDCVRTRWPRAVCNWVGDPPSIV